MAVEHNKGYDPELWISVYRYFDRYLENISEEALIRRLQAIRRNRRVLVDSDGVHPITSFLGTLYWFRKEQLTCEEFRLRGLQLPAESPVPTPPSIRMPTRLKGKRRGGEQYLVRYDTFDRLRPMFASGRLYLGPAARCNNPLLGPARHDDELQKAYYTAGKGVRVTTQDGTYQIIGDLKRATQLESYYFLSTSYVFDTELFDAFNRDSCLVIHDPMEFANRLEQATSSLFFGWHFYHFPVEYFDPHEKPLEQAFGASISKDFWYAFEKEYRFFWEKPRGAAPVTGEHFVTLGPLDDIAEIFRLS